MPIATLAMDLASEIVKQPPSAVDANGDRDMASDVDVQIQRAVGVYLRE